MYFKGGIRRLFVGLSLDNNVFCECTMKCLVGDSEEIMWMKLFE